jgi:hypothetical protein
MTNRIPKLAACVFAFFFSLLASAQTPQLTHVTGQIFDASGNPAANVRVTIHRIIIGGTAVSTRDVVYYSDSSGNVDFYILRNSVAYIEAFVVGFNKTGGCAATIPDSPSIAFSSLVCQDTIPTSPSIIINALGAQAAHSVFIGPSSGSPANASFRALIAGDLPAHTHAESDVTNLVSDLAAKQAANANLTAIAGLAPANNDVLQYKAGAWVNRTPAQLKADLAIATSDVSGFNAAAAAAAPVQSVAARTGAVTLGESDIANLVSDLAGKQAALGFTPLNPANNLSDVGSAATARANIGAGTGNGTVTSVGISMPAEFNVSGSPVTGIGTLTVTRATQVANSVMAGPTTGAAAVPNFRALVTADIPSLTSAKISDFSSAASAAARPYKVYTALVTQSGTSAPTDTVLENTTGGTITWARTAQGTYTISISGTTFTANKTALFYTNGSGMLTANQVIVPVVTYTSTSVITVETRAEDALAGTSGDQDGKMTATVVEIRIYP